MQQHISLVVLLLQASEVLLCWSCIILLSNHHKLHRRRKQFPIWRCCWQVDKHRLVSEPGINYRDVRILDPMVRMQHTRVSVSCRYSGLGRKS